jgi:hypothetical protein
MSEQQLVPIDAAQNYKLATSVAALCKEIVLKTSAKIQGKSFVKVEGWQSIAAAHGCIPEIESCTETDIEGVHGIVCWAVLRRMSDQAILSRACGFVGSDESTWGGRNKYARIAMAQTRAMSRVCRHAFAYVVVMMDAGLETTPAEEIPVESSAAKPAAYQTIQGKVTDYYGEHKQRDGTLSWGARINGISVWTKDQSLGTELGEAKDLAVIAQVVINPKSGKGRLINFDPVPQAVEEDEPEAAEAPF